MGEAPGQGGVGQGSVGVGLLCGGFHIQHPIEICTQQLLPFSSSSGEAVVLRGQDPSCGFAPALHLTTNRHLALPLSGMTQVRGMGVRIYVRMDPAQAGNDGGGHAIVYFDYAWPAVSSL